MKTIVLDDEIPCPLKTMNKTYNFELKNKAKKIIYFKNYVPVDKELGMKSHDPVVDIEQEQKRIDLKIKKSVQKCLSDAKHPMKIIPKKPTLDLERKLQSKFDKLKLRTELSIIELLREEKEGTQKLREGEKRENQFKIQNDVPDEAAPERGQTNQLAGAFKHLSEDPKILASQKFEMVNWLEDFSKTKLNISSDILADIEKKQAMQGDLSDDEF